MKTEIYKKDAIMADLTKYCHLSNEHDVIEITPWHNGEGFDITIQKNDLRLMSLTWGEIKAINKLIKKLNNADKKRRKTSA